MEQYLIYRYIAFVVYIAALILIGFWGYKKFKGLDGFTVGGRRFGKLPMVGTFVGGFVSAASVIGYVAFAYQKGWALITIYGIGCAGGWLLLGILSGRIRRIGKGYTSSDIYGLRYHSPANRIWFAIVFVLWNTFFLIQQYMGSGYLIEQFLGIPYAQAITIMAAILIIYTTLGGMSSVVWTDVLQASVMVIGVFICVPIAVKIGGGFSAINAAVAEKGLLSPDVQGTVKPTFIIGNLLALSFVIACVTYYHRHMLSAKDQKTAMASIGLGTLVLIPFYLSLCIIGIASAKIVPGLDTPDKAFPALVAGHLPTVVGVIVSVCLMAAIMSTVDSLLVAVGTMAANDIYGEIYKQVKGKDAPEKRIVRLIRYCIAGSAILGLVISYKPPGTIMTIYNVMIGVMSSTLFPPLIMGLYWQRATKEGALVGSILGLATATLWKFLGPSSVPMALIGVPVGFITIAIVSVLTKKTDPETLAVFFPEQRK